MLTALLLTTTIAVIDGDTIRYGGQTVRIANIDTAETGWRAKCDAERRLGMMAKARLRQLLAKGDVQIHPGDMRTVRRKPQSLPSALWRQ